MTRIKKYDAILMLIMSILIQPDFTTQFKPLFAVYALADILIFLYLFIPLTRKAKLSRTTMTWIFIRLYLLILMIVNSNLSDVDKWGRLTIIVLDYMLIFQREDYRGTIDRLIKCLSNLGVIYLLINVITVILFPTGIVSNYGGHWYFLGTRNSMVSYFFPFLAASGLVFFKTGKRKNLLFTAILVLGLTLYFKISTSIVILGLFIIIYVFRLPLKKYLKLLITIPASMVASIGFVLFNASNMFTFILVNILGKDSGLNSRSDIWAVAINKIVETPIGMIFGHGIVNSGDFIKLYGLNWPAHNQLVQWLFEIGIIGTLMTVLFLLSFDDSSATTKEHYFIRSMITAIAIGCISSNFFDISCIYILFLMLLYLGKNYYWRASTHEHRSN